MPYMLTYKRRAFFTYVEETARGIVSYKRVISAFKYRNEIG